METKIKNFIEEGEKEFKEKFVSFQPDGTQGWGAGLYLNDKVMPEDIKDFTSSRQISLIKMIVEEVKDINPDIGILAACNISSEANHYVNGFNQALDTISSKLKEIIK